MLFVDKKAVGIIRHLRCQDQQLKSTAGQQPHKADYTGSCQMTAVEQLVACLLLIGLIAWEHNMLLAYTANGCTKIRKG